MPLPRRRGIVCLVTDRRRLLPAESLDAQLRALVQQARAAARAGADLFQIRERDLPDGIVASLVEEVVRAASGFSLQILVNDRVDVAVAAGAHGVQLRSDGVAPADARRVAPEGFLLGSSVHDADGAASASRTGADFAVFGTVYPSASKAGAHRYAGIPGLTAASRAADVPVLAIGGVGAANVREVAAVAAGVAAIGWFATTDPFRLAEAIRAARCAFDTVDPLI